MLPNLLVVGAQKSGTTTLHDMLSRHPEVSMSTKKEINYFTNHYKKGLEYYRSFFNVSQDEYLITGESSPGYMCYPGVARKIKETLGDIKIVMVLRNPVQRSLSQYWDNRRHLKEHLLFSEVIEKYLHEEYEPGVRGYFSRGVYMKYINEYLDYFDKKNLHIIIFEELLTNTKKTLSELYNFLEISVEDNLLHLDIASNTSRIWDNTLYRYLLNNPSWNRLIPKHARRFIFFGKRIPYKYQTPTQEEVERLNLFYKGWNRQLSDFLQKDLSYWNE